MSANLNDFKQEQECIYKNENYKVRDNGAILRNARKNNRLRSLDNQWTFGKLNGKTGYLKIATIRVHRIVAMAFHGEPPTKEHVVDHIDTNKQNNRPENLRWVTRLENVLLNPITTKRIELVCGSVEAFLDNPSKFRDKFQEPNYKWMCTVNTQEAQASKERLLAWAKSDKPLQGGTLEEWVYNRDLPKAQIDEAPKFTNSLTQNAKQKNWKTPTEFLCCPKDIGSNPIKLYAANLKAKKVFSHNQYSKSIIENFAISNDENILWVMCKNSDDSAIKPYSLAEVSFQNNFFIHNNLGSFFQKAGAEKRFTLAQGLEWMGEDGIDDFC